MTGNSCVIDPRGDGARAGADDGGMRSFARNSICARSISRARACRCWATWTRSFPTCCSIDGTAVAARHAVTFAIVEAPRRRRCRPAIDAALAADWLTAFLRDELAIRRKIRSRRRRTFGRRRLGGDRLSVCARARSGQRLCIRACRTRRRALRVSPMRRLVVDALGITLRTIEITAGGRRLPAVRAGSRRTPARQRHGAHANAVLFDQSAKLGALPVGTGNKTERLLGYFTWHADDTPPVNPIGDLFKTQVWALARVSGRSAQADRQSAAADFEAEQTDEGDLGIILRSRRCDSGAAARGIFRRATGRSRLRSRRRRAGAAAGRRHALETPSSDHGDAHEHRDQRVLPAPSRLLGSKH